MKVTHFLSRRLKNVGLYRPDAKALAEYVQFQLDHQGVENTVRFLKQCGDTLVFALTGSGQKSPWVKTRDGYPVGFISLRSYDESIQLRVAKIARSIRLESPTNKQVRKVVDAVVRPIQAESSSVETLKTLMGYGLDHFGITAVPMSEWKYPLVTRQFRRIQSVSSRRTGVTSEPPILESLSIIKGHSFLSNLPDWWTAFSPFTEKEVKDVMALVPSGPDSVGEIHAAQEGGAKLRMFASPYTVVQSLLSPIHYWVDGFRRLCPTDCTYDQLSGALFAQEALRSCVEVYSVDLSTATCRFPLGPQLWLLDLLGLDPRFSSALAEVCTGSWKVGKEISTPFKRRTLRWRVGQPLGIKPSMSMFSLCHNLLLAGICQLHGVEASNTFRVLGDDVIITHRLVAQDYMAIIQRAGIPISWEKTHTSNQFAEFAGASITRDTLLRPGQWRPANWSNWDSLALDLGRPLRGEVTTDMREAQRLILFIEGKYDPSPQKWGKWLRAASHLKGQLWNDFQFRTAAPLWHDKIQKVFNSQIARAGLNYQLRHRSSGINVKAEVVGHLINNPHTSVALYALRFQSWQRPSDMIIWCVWQCYVGLAIACEKGSITLEEFYREVSNLTDRARSQLYLPPRANQSTGSPYLERALKALAA